MNREEFTEQLARAVERAQDLEDLAIDIAKLSLSAAAATAREYGDGPLNGSPLHVAGRRDGAKAISLLILALMPKDPDHDR